MTEGAHGHANGGATTARLDALEKDLSDLKGQQRSTDTKIDERTKTQWPVILGTGGLILTAVVYLLNQNAGGINDLKMRLDRDLVTREEHKAINEREAALRLALEDRLKRVEETSNSVYSSRDVILDLKTQIDRLQMRLEGKGHEQP